MTAKITNNKTMDQLQKIYDAIAAEGFSAGVLAMIDNYARRE